MPSLDINPAFQEALRIMGETKTSLFLTGKAGTGKSTLLKHFCATTKKQPVILAPTGVAALNVGGQTIHSFFNFQIDVTPEKILKKKKIRDPKLFKKLQTLIIDEVSMLRADLLDCIETFLRLHGPVAGQPFGGVQMVFIGDLYQLPPVVTSTEREIFQGHYVTPYFFSAHAMQDFPLETIELEKVYRQKDQIFVDLLNRVRNNTVTEQDLAVLNERCGTNNAEKPAICLTVTNKNADDINLHHLTTQKGKVFVSEAKISGDFGKEYYPTATLLSFKVGAQIMMLNNDSSGRWVNGSLGTIKKVEMDTDDDETVIIHLHDTGKDIEVGRHKWEVFRFSLGDNQIVTEPAGTFTQYPFRLAWAVTIHKSQGKTFDQVMIDLGAGTFAAGQTYVALSRCTSLEGITLKTRIKPQNIRTDPRIRGFMVGQHTAKAETALPRTDKIQIIRRAIKEKKQVEIVYLTGKDTKTTRLVRPLTLGEETYQGKNFTGMKAFCTLRKEERMFSVERILEIKG